VRAIVAPGTGRHQFNETVGVVDPNVLLSTEAELVDVEGLGAVDIGNWNCDHLEPEDHRLDLLSSGGAAATHGTTASRRPPLLR
jgi:hypothetical protein